MTNETNDSWALRFLSLIVMHIVLVMQYRLGMLIQPTWLAYAFMGLIMVVCSLPWMKSRWRVPWPSAIAGTRVWGGAATKRHIGFGAIILIIFMVGGLFARYLWVRRLPIDPNLGDMLPQVQQAIGTWLAGEFPYRVQHYPWPIHLPYPPALWMAYIPATLAGVDLRYTALICLAAMGTAWFFQYNGLAKQNKPAPVLGGWVMLVGAFYLSPLVVRFVIQGHTAPYWLVLTFLPLMLHFRKHYVVAILLGLVCAMRQPSVLFVPVLWWHWMKTESWQKATRYVGVAAVSSLLIYLPFIAQDAAAVVWTPIRQYSTVGHETFLFNPSMILETIGFSNLFYLAGMNRWISPASVAVFSVLFAWNLHRMNTAMDAIRVMALVSLGFALLSPIPFYYEYFPVLILFTQAWWMEAMGSAEPQTNSIPARAK